MHNMKKIIAASLVALPMVAAAAHPAPEVRIASSVDSDWPEMDEKPRVPKEPESETDKSTANDGDAKKKQEGNAVDPDFPDQSDENGKSPRRPASSGTSNQGASSVDPDWPSQ